MTETNKTYDQTFLFTVAFKFFVFKIIKTNHLQHQADDVFKKISNKLASGIHIVTKQLLQFGKNVFQLLLVTIMYCTRGLFTSRCTRVLFVIIIIIIIIIILFFEEQSRTDYLLT